MRNLLFVGALTWLIAADAASLNATVDWIATSNTLEWPEVHVLLRNRDEREINFIVNVDKQLTCHNAGSAQMYELQSTYFWPAEGQRYGPKGTIPPSGWNHRTFRLGADPNLRQLLPCTVTASVTFYRGTEKSTEQIELELTDEILLRAWEEPEPGTLVGATLVELDETTTGEDVFVRVLLLNSKGKGIMVQQLDKDIVCLTPCESLARWSISPRIRQGEAGPIYIEPNGWGVLVDLVLIDDVQAYEHCTLRFRLGGVGREFETMEVPLKPQAKFLRLFRHHVPPPPPS